MDKGEPVKHGIDHRLVASTWRKSKRSGGNNNCVEVASLIDGRQLVGDTKDPDQPALVVSGSAFGHFLSAVKAGAFN